MKKNHIIYIAVLTVCSSITLSSFIKTTGGHPSATGGPGELGTCANATTGCHATASITNDNTHIVNTLMYSAADSSYVPNQTYTVTVQAKKTGIAKFGFEIVALSTSSNSNAGTWVITDVARTHTITGTGSLAARKYVTHSTSGTPQTSAGMDVWSFNWKAPASNVGNIKFYYATNCTNNDAANTGDQLFLSSFQIHPFSTTSIAEWINAEDFQAILNPLTNELVLNYELTKGCDMSVHLFDAQGRMIKITNSTGRSAGKYSDHIELSQNISSGIYFVNIIINNQSLTKKIMI